MSTIAAVPQVERTAGSTRPLREFQRNVHSQFGEDGIIEEVFHRLGVDPSSPEGLWCVEFGAWDGKHLSNTRKLIEDTGASAVLIEPDPKRYRELVGNNDPFDRVITMRRRVAWRGDDRLDAILAQTPCPRRFDLLSIDVDGHDYWIWCNLVDYRPTVVVIEFNPTIPHEAVYIPPHDPSKRHGCSLAAIAHLAGYKRYRLVAVTETNAILVVDERADELGLVDTSIPTLTDGLTDFTTYLFQTHDGELLVGGNRCFMWHQVIFDEHTVQALPRFLRRHPEELGPFRRLALRVLRRLRQARHDRWLDQIELERQRLEKLYADGQ